MTWWAATFKNRSAELIIPLLRTCGAYGAQENADGSVECYVQGDESAFKEFLACAQGLGLTGEGARRCDETNWVARCEELTTPIVLGSIRIIPVTSAETIPAPPLPPMQGTKDLFIIPGMGFGTGHHPATAMCVEFLQHEAVRSFAPTRALDYGTGSGLLALVASTLYGCEVIAVDVDPDAIANAIENASLNPHQKNVQLTVGDLTSAKGTFDLVLANIYAEVLHESEPGLRKCTRSNGRLILSGIMPEKEDLVLSQYRLPHWKQLDRNKTGDWVSLLFVRT